MWKKFITNVIIKFRSSIKSSKDLKLCCANTKHILYLKNPETCHDACLRNWTSIPGVFQPTEHGCSINKKIRRGHHISDIGDFIHLIWCINKNNHCIPLKHSTSTRNIQWKQCFWNNMKRIMNFILEVFILLWIGLEHSCLYFIVFVNTMSK